MSAPASPTDAHARVDARIRLELEAGAVTLEAVRDLLCVAPVQITLPRARV